MAIAARQTSRNGTTGARPISPTATLSTLGRAPPLGPHSLSQSTSSTAAYWQHVETPRFSEDSRIRAPRESKKRPWPHSPDLEDARRREARPRLAGTTPRLLNGYLPSEANPWAGNEGRSGSRNDAERREAAHAVSTPVVSSTRGLEYSPTLSQINTSGRPPTPHARSDSESPIATRARDVGHANNNAQVETHSPRSQPMEVDREDALETEDARTREPSPQLNENTTREGKGKAKATHAEDSEESDYHEEEYEEGWNEQELAEARQRSLRQLLEDRSHNADRRRNGGPSGSSRMGEQRWGSASQPAGPSGTWRREDEEARVAHEFETHEWEIPSRNDYRRAGQHRENSLAHSEYRPLPNTRAAAYLDQTNPRRATSRADMLLPRRSPMSRMAGLQRPQSPPAMWSSPTQDHFYRGNQEADARPRPSQNGREWEEHDASRYVEREASRHVERNVSRRREDTRREEEQARPTEDREPRLHANEGERDWDEEEGEIMPTVLNARPGQADRAMAEPTEGFPRIHCDDPETRIRGMAMEWVEEIWSDPPNTTVLVDIFNYQNREDDAYNRRISETLRAYLERISGESGFDVVPPEADTRPNVRARDLPTMWAIRGLSPDGVARATRTHVWSFPGLSFFTFPRATTMPHWVCMLEGFLDGNVERILRAVKRELTEREMVKWIARMVRSNPSFHGYTTAEAIHAIISSARVEVIQMGNGNYLANVFIRPPTRDVHEWRDWVAELRSRRYRTFANGTGRVRHVVLCSGCRSVCHLSHICPFPRLRGWNGPDQGDGVFGERTRSERRGESPRRRGRGNGNARRGNDRESRGGSGRWTPKRRDDSKKGWRKDEGPRGGRR